MAKKRKPGKPQKIAYSNSPFSHLKGFAVSADKTEQEKEVVPTEVKADPLYGSFADAMALLGVDRIDSAGDADAERETNELAELKQNKPPTVPDDESEFLQAMGELQVNFSDRFPEQERPPRASARRMKQLKQGKLAPEETLDLHGLQRVDVAEKLHFFLQDSVHQGYQTLLVITGRGLHSVAGEPVLRTEAERYLAAEGRKWVAEWGRAPKQYGGAGALILFLRRRPR